MHQISFPIEEFEKFLFLARVRIFDLPMKYDIFISYRREGGKEIARSINSYLDARGFSTFLDFDELKDGVFDERIIHAIDEAPIFIFILSRHSLDRCVNESDWVRKEIEYAALKGKHIIPINPDGEFKYLPDDLPETISEVLGRNQYSEIMMGQLFQASMHKMLDERVLPFVKKKHHSKKSIEYTILSIAFILLLAGSYIFSNKMLARSDVRRCTEYLDRAEELIEMEDSIVSAYDYIKEANTIIHGYDGSSYQKLFGSRCNEVLTTYKRVKDSLYREYKSNAEVCYHLNKIDDSLIWIDKALKLNDSEDLRVMKSVLTSRR